MGLFRRKKKEEVGLPKGWKKTPSLEEEAKRMFDEGYYTKEKYEKKLEQIKKIRYERDRKNWQDRIAWDSENWYDQKYPSLDEDDWRIETYDDNSRYGRFRITCHNINLESLDDDFEKIKRFIKIHYQNYEYY